MAQKNVRGQSKILDNFYTKPHVAKYFINTTERILHKSMADWSLIVEPSAGNGAFFYDLPGHNRIGIDIASKSADIQRTDFLKWNASQRSVDPNNILVIGNPPFGQNGSLARSFIEHAFTFAKTVAFILPASFKKSSMQNKIKPRNAWLIYQEDVPDSSFTYEGVSKNIPAVFQIWKLQESPRKQIDVRLTHPDFDFIRPDYDFLTSHANRVVMIQRVGVEAGTVSTDLNYQLGKITSRNFFFILAKSQDVYDLLLTLGPILKNSEEKYQTAGMPSVSMGEIVMTYITEKEKNELGGNRIASSHMNSTTETKSFTHSRTSSMFYF